MFFLSQKGIPLIGNDITKVSLVYYQYQTNSSTDNNKIAVYYLFPQKVYLGIKFYTKDGKNYLLNDILSPNINVL